MKTLRLILYLLPVIIPGIISCSKSSDCFTSTGKVIRQTRNIPDFDSIVAEQNVDIILTQDTLNSVVVEAGEKIINGITTTFQNGHLIITNTNTCNWVRSYDSPLNVYLHMKNLKNIWYLSAGNITSTNTMYSNSFTLEVWGGCGSINLSLYVGLDFIYEHMGTADITIKGNAISSSIVSGDFGLLQLKDLQSDYCYVSNTGSNDCYINVKKYLDASIGSIGNIYYTGNPDTVYSHITGTGQLIHF